MPVPVFKASPRLPTIRIAPGLWAVLFMFTQTAAADGKRPANPSVN